MKPFTDKHGHLGKTMVCELVSQGINKEELMNGCHEGRFIISAADKNGKIECFLVEIVLEDPGVLSGENYVARRAYPKISMLKKGSCPGGHKENSGVCLSQKNAFQRIKYTFLFTCFHLFRYCQMLGPKPLPRAGVPLKRCTPRKAAHM